MPNNIKAMLEQNYKKIAIINLYKNIDLRNGDDVEQTFQLNLSFKPSKIFVTIENICISNENQRSFYVPNGERGMHYSFQIINFDENSITIKPKMLFVSGGTYFQDATLKQVIAIE